MHCQRCGVPLDADRAETLLHLDIAWWDLCGPCVEAEHGPAVNAANQDPDAFARHVTATHGFLELGLPRAAWDELEAIEPANRRAEVPVLGIRVAIFHALERWEATESLVNKLPTPVREGGGGKT